MGLSQLKRFIERLDEGVIVFDGDAALVAANRAAIEIHGCGEVPDLGRDAAQYGARFAFCEAGGKALPAALSPVARLCAGEEFADLELKTTRPATPGFARLLEFSVLILNDPSGRPQYRILIVRNKVDREDVDVLFERFFASKPAPAAILRLSDSRYLDANERFCELLGFSRQEIIGRPLHALDVFQGVSDRETALRALTDHVMIRPQESSVRMRDGANRAVVVSGQPVEFGEKPCMLLTLVDLESQKRAEIALRQSEERFAKAFRMAPVPMLVCVQSNWCVTEVNGAFLNAVGRQRSDVIGYPAMSVGLHLSPKSLREIGQALENNNKIRNREMQLLAVDGVLVDAVLSAESVVIQEEVCALLVIQDVTERKRTEAELMSAIEAVMKDASWFSRTIMDKLAHVRRREVASQSSENLTPREREVLERICAGQSDPEIAQALKLSRNTVRNHVAALYGKIGVNRRAAAVVWGRERGYGSL